MTTTPQKIVNNNNNNNNVIETSGAWNAQAIELTQEIGRRTTAVTGNNNNNNIQRFNAVLLHDGFPSEDHLD